MAFDHVAATDPHRIESIENSVQEKNCWIICKEEKINGYAILKLDFFGHHFIDLIYVAQEYRRKGYAQQLIQHIEKNCTTGKIFTSTNQSNQFMQCLLTKLGYTRSGFLEGLDENDPEVFYMKCL
jgi:GNAT superfamily N-acetyltransferase